MILTHTAEASYKPITANCNSSSPEYSINTKYICNLYLHIWSFGFAVIKIMGYICGISEK